MQPFDLLSRRHSRVLVTRGSWAAILVQGFVNLVVPFLVYRKAMILDRTRKAGTGAELPPMGRESTESVAPVPRTTDGQLDGDSGPVLQWTTVHDVTVAVPQWLVEWGVSDVRLAEVLGALVAGMCVLVIGLNIQELATGKPLEATNT